MRGLKLFQRNYGTFINITHGAAPELLRERFTQHTNSVRELGHNLFRDIKKGPGKIMYGLFEKMPMSVISDEGFIAKKSNKSNLLMVFDSPFIAAHIASEAHIYCNGLTLKTAPLEKSGLYLYALYIDDEFEVVRPRSNFSGLMMGACIPKPAYWFGKRVTYNNGQVVLEKNAAGQQHAKIPPQCENSKEFLQFQEGVFEFNHQLIEMICKRESDCKSLLSMSCNPAPAAGGPKV